MAMRVSSRAKALRRFFRFLEVQRNRAVGPWIIELMAAIAANHYVDSETLRGFGKAARLVAKFTYK